MRTQARETLFKIIFASQFCEQEEGFYRAMYKADKLDANDEEYCNGILKIAKEHGSEISEIIDKHSRIFPESRLFPADRSVLIIALSEILFSEGVPAPVSVNEAANIASKYSSENSASFVSGIASEIIRERGNV